VFQLATIGLVRHGITNWNLEGRLQGSVDIPLNSTGRQQAELLGERLAKELQWDLLLTSDLSRAAETAGIISNKLQLPVATESSRIREISCGLLEGTSEKDRINNWGPNWHEMDLGMEPRVAVGRRGAEFIEEIAAEHTGKRILIVSHGTLIAQSLKQLIPDYQWERSVKNTSITILEHSGNGWSCPLYACTKHLV
jgi:2,3-bisphosphoglycerate-dependent phosphoglycerate mutase